MRGYLDGDVMECGDHGRDCLGIGEIYVQKCFIEPSCVEMCYLQRVGREGGRADSKKEVEEVIRWCYSSMSSAIHEPKSVHNSPSAPNGIWNISAIQGRSHELKVWEKASQSISPSPVPHSTKHWSYVRVNGGGGSVGPCVAFHSVEYWFCRLAAHFQS